MQIWEDLKTIHQACEFALRIVLHHKFLWALKAKDQLMSSIMMIQPLGVAVKMREILTSSLPRNLLKCKGKKLIVVVYARV